MFNFQEFFDINLSFGQFMSMTSTRQPVVSIFINLIDALSRCVDKVSALEIAVMQRKRRFLYWWQATCLEKSFLEHEFFKAMRKTSNPVCF